MTRLATIALGAILTALAPACIAQAWPAKPVRLIVPDGPGSVSDVRARQLTARMQEHLGQPIVVDNRPGGSMVIGAEAAAKSAPDGYTVFFGNITTHSTNPLLLKTLPYRPDELVPVTLVTAGPMILVVGPDVPAKSLKELLAHARATPGGLQYGVIGQGSMGHILMESVKARTGAAFEYVAYKSSAQYIQDLVAGHLRVGLNFWGVLGPHIKAGKMRALAVTSSKRLEAAPDIPTFAEAGLPGIEAFGWQGLMVPAGTPRPIIDRLREAAARALQAPDLRSQLIDTGAEVGGNTPEEFAAFVRADAERWKKAVADAKLAPQ